MQFLCLVGAAAVLTDCRPHGHMEAVSPSGRCRILSYNVQNLFDFVWDGSEYSEFVPGNADWSDSYSHTKLMRIARVLNAADADVIVLQEIENRHVLLDLARQLRGGYVAVLDSLAASLATRAAVLSRLPVRAVSVHPVPFDTTVLPRPILEVHVDLGGCPLIIFANHWPSRHHPNAQRLAAAKALGKRIEQLPDSSDFVVAGDFNLDFTSPALASKAPGPRTEYDSVMVLLHDRSGNPPMDPWMELPAAHRWSYVYRKKRHTFDHLLLSASLLDTAGPSYVPGSFTVFRWHGRLLRSGKPYAWRMRWVNGGLYHTGEGYSDHLPVLVELR